MRKYFISTILCGFLAAGLAGPAFAHAHLESAVPPASGTVAGSPTALNLTFSEAVNLKFSGVKVIGPQKKPVQTGKATLAGGNATLMVPISGKLDAGTYTVDWHVLSADGHKTKGSYSFTVNP